MEGYFAFLADCVLRFEFYLRPMVTGGIDSTDSAVDRIKFWQATYQSHVTHLIPKKPVDLVSLTIKNKGMNFSLANVKQLVCEDSVKDARRAHIINNLVCPQPKNVMEPEATASKDNSLLYHPDEWALTMFLCISCCSGDDITALKRLQYFANGNDISK